MYLYNIDSYIVGNYGRGESRGAIWKSHAPLKYIYPSSLPPHLLQYP